MKNIIKGILPGSIAEELEILPGEELLSINGEKIRDIIDYRYLIADEYLELLIKTSDGEEYIAEVEKEAEEDLGLIFENGLMDEARGCRNKCVFCFIDQLPRGMRETLYFKDDDSRLSFLQGNYVTLTNMSDEEIKRLAFYHLSPINISVHSTDSVLRRKMLNNKNAGELMPRLKILSEAGIDLNFQIVLCRGVNDGEALLRSIDELFELGEHARSLSVVPAGLTKYREGLFPLSPFDKEESAEIIRLIEKKQQEFKSKRGSAFVFAADEFYISGELPIPPCEAYEDFPQLENGVGMLALLKEEFEEALFNAKKEKNPFEGKGRIVSLATGIAAADHIKDLCEKAQESFPGLKINVYPIKNDFFGHKITVSGLLTGGDIIAQLSEKELGDKLLLPGNLLRSGEHTLLDDVTIEDIEKALNIKISITDGGKSLLEALLSE
ncbi:MAG: DUF512 domain-containing protein [Firmicutes bacterium]|nr:DUF512 domain-containing protein [Bacillota bacterium]